MNRHPPSSRALRRAPFLAAVAALVLAPIAVAQCPESSVPIAGAIQGGAEFGTAVALAGDVAVIGAPGWSPPGGSPEGAVFVSTWTGSAWVSSQLPTPASIVAGDRFGQSVAVNEDGTVIAVGAPFHDGAAPDGGKVVVYEWSPGPATWLPTLEVNGLYGSGLFGNSVTASGDRVAAGEPGGVFALGSVSVTRRTAPGTWVADGYLVGVEAFALFGFAVALEGDLLVVGAPLDDEPLVDTGSVDVFEWQGGPWVLRDHLTKAVGEASSFFGWSVAHDDIWLAVGAPGSTSNHAGGMGSIYRWDGSAYGAWFTHWSNDTGTRLGQSIAIDGDRAAMGAPAMDEGLGFEAGRTTAIQRVPWGYWSLETEYLVGSAPQPGAQFGFANALSGRRLLLGQPFASVGGQASAGRVFAYDLDGTIVHTDLGQGLAGQGGVVPQLSGDSGMCGTGLEHVLLHDGRPGAPTWAVLGLDVQPLPFKGGVLVPRPDFIVSLFAVAPDGTAGMALDVPTGLPAFSVWYQFWFQDPAGPKGVSASNGMRSDVPPY